VPCGSPRGVSFLEVSWGLCPWTRSSCHRAWLCGKPVDLACVLQNGVSCRTLAGIRGCTRGLTAPAGISHSQTGLKWALGVTDGSPPPLPLAPLPSDCRFATLGKPNLAGPSSAFMTPWSVLSPLPSPDSLGLSLGSLRAPSIPLPNLIQISAAEIRLISTVGALSGQRGTQPQVLLHPMLFETKVK